VRGESVAGEVGDLPARRVGQWSPGLHRIGVPGNPPTRRCPLFDLFTFVTVLGKDIRIAPAYRGASVSVTRRNAKGPGANYATNLLLLKAQRNALEKRVASAEVKLAGTGKPYIVGLCNAV